MTKVAETLPQTSKERGEQFVKDFAACIRGLLPPSQTHSPGSIQRQLRADILLRVGGLVLPQT